MTEPKIDRKTVLAAFTNLTGLPDLRRVVQRGRDPQTARFTLELADGREVRVGTINTLWSRAELSKTLAVAIGRVIAPIKPADWTASVGALFAHAVDVEETPDETFEETVREWLTKYAQRASSDPAAAAMREPFRKDKQIYIAAAELTKYIRREYSEQIKLPEVRQALADLGFHVTHVSYQRRNGNGTSRSSASYYTAPLAVLRETTE